MCRRTGEKRLLIFLMSLGAGMVAEGTSHDFNIDVKVGQKKISYGELSPSSPSVQISTTKSGKSNQNSIVVL